MTTMANSRLVLALLAVTLICLPACIQPGSIDDPDVKADAAPGAPKADADINNPPPPGAPDAEPAGAPSFASDVYPLLQSGGKNCVSCHGAGGIMASFPYDDGATATLQRLMQGGQRVNLGSPATSLVLTKPLTASGVNHRAKLFASTSDPAYKLILSWITSGAAP